MLSKYHKNTVMHGCLDYFCLACETHLKTDEDVNLHIEKPVHKKNLGLAVYVESCASDRIRKVNKRYYCECCNILLATMTKVNLHIREDKHDFNKTDETDGDMKKSVFIKWIKNSVVAFDDLLISEKAWNGFVEDNCVVCDSEFEDAAVHRSEVGHLLKMIQAKVQVGADNFISRKIDDTSFQCLTCNTVISHGEMITHYDRPEHTTLYLECRKAKRALLANNGAKEEKKEVKKEEPKIVHNGNKEEKKIEGAKKEEQKKEATEKKETKKPPKKEAEKKPEVIPKVDNEETSPYDKDVNQVLGTKEYIKILPDNMAAMCMLCDWTIDIFSIPQHIHGQHHQTLLQMQAARAADMKKGQKSTKKEIAEEKTQKSTKTQAAEQKTEKKPAVDENKSKIVDSLETFQKNDIRIDIISEKAFCKKCSANVNYVFEDIEKHIADHKSKQNTASGEKYPNVDKNHNKTEVKRPEAAKATPPPVEDVETFAKKNEITYNKTHSKAYCRLCETKVPSTLKCLQEHVQGNSHQLKKNKHQKVEVIEEDTEEDILYETKSTEDYINVLTVVETSFRMDCVINDDICVSMAAFTMTTRMEGGRYRCQVCEKTLLGAEISEHKDSKRHERNMMKTKVLYTIDDEFIREVRKGIYHCGFCNQIEAGWESLQEHLKSIVHRESKTGCEWALQEHLPAVRDHRFRRQHAEFTFIMRILMGKLV